MKINIEDPKATIELGLGRYADEGNQRVRVPVNKDVQAVLRSLARDTWNQIADSAGEPPVLDISEQYPTPFPCKLPLDDPLCQWVRDLYNSNPAIDSDALDEAADIDYYFGMFTDKKGNKVIGVRRGGEFKGVSKKKLITLIDDSAVLIKGAVFAFNDVFDYLIDAETVWILNPTGFHRTAQTEAAVLAAAQGNADHVGTVLGFIDATPLANYCKKHPAGAKLLASIRHRTDLADTVEHLLVAKLDDDEVEYTNTADQIAPAQGSEMDFLKVLDRRRFTTRLVNGVSEHYDAASRRAV